MPVSSISPSAAVNPAVLAIERLHRDIESSDFRLASGNRLRETGDDTASFSIATTLQSQRAGLRRGFLNGAEADSLLQVAEQGLERVRGVLEQLQSLTAQADTGVLTDNQRNFLDTSFQSLASEIDSIVAQTTFGGVRLLDGSASPFAFVVSADGASTINVTIDAVDTTSLFGGATPTIATQPDAQAAAPVVQTANNTVKLLLAEVTGNQLAIETARRTLSAGIQGTGNASNALLNTNLVEELPLNASLRVRQEAALATTAQTQTLSSNLLDLLKLDFQTFDFLATEA